MTAAQIIKHEFEGAAISFNEEGWFNATEAAAKYSKRPNDWLVQHSTKEYISALKECLGISEDASLIKTRRGRNTSQNGNNSGTWLHPKLGVAFARWLDVRFSVWCDIQIDGILRNQIDFKKLRSEAASTNKVVAAMLQLSRADQGKETMAHHYMNEAKLVNWALTGKFEGLDRDKLSSWELQLLSKLEAKNAVLIGRNLAYQQRKTIIEQYAVDLRGTATAQITHSTETPDA